MKYFTSNQLAKVHRRALPHHVALIMDGNRRWAKKKFFKSLKTPWSGHWEGAETLTKLVEAAQELGIGALTVFAFSTENWSRSEQEISILIKIFETYLRKNRQRMCAQNIRLHVIGELAPFPSSLKEEIARSVEATASCDGIDFVVALNYGGRDDLRRACQKIVAAVERGEIEKEELCEKRIASYLDTAPFSDPDLLIRTSGERRLSNFLLWQLAYSEIYVTDTLWPDFTPRELLIAVLDFQKRKRRMGR